MGRFAPVRETTKQHKRMLKVSHKPLDPPREVKYTGKIVSWKRPQDIRNVTHYRIYRNTEYNLVRQVPVGQQEINDIGSADRLFVSSWNEQTQHESRKVPLLERISNGIPRSIVFGYSGDITVEDDAFQHVEIGVDSGQVFRCLRARVWKKPETATAVTIDVQYSTDSYDTLYDDRTWNSLFATADGELVLPANQMQMETPLSVFASDPLYLPPLCLVRCNIKSGDGADLVVSIDGEVCDAVDSSSDAYSAAAGFSANTPVLMAV